MFEYKFVRIDVSFWQKPQGDYQKIIEEHTQEGWRFVQVFAPGLSSAGNVKYFDLIFEREK
jgi:hypothetical protein